MENYPKTYFTNKKLVFKRFISRLFWFILAIIVLYLQVKTGFLIREDYRIALEPLLADATITIMMLGGFMLLYLFAFNAYLPASTIKIYPNEFEYISGTIKWKALWGEVEKIYNNHDRVFLIKTTSGFTRPIDLLSLNKEQDYSMVASSEKTLKTQEETLAIAKEFINDVEILSGKKCEIISMWLTKRSVRHK